MQRVSAAIPRLLSQTSWIRPVTAVSARCSLANVTAKPYQLLLRCGITGRSYAAINQQQHVQQTMKHEEENNATVYLESLDQDGQKQLKIVKLEHDFLLSQGLEAPEEMSNVMWVEALQCKSRSQRSKLYRFFFKRDMTRRNEKERRLAAKSANPPENEYTYNYGNKILRRISASEYHKNNLAHAMVYGPHVVVDMGYTNMTKREQKNLVEQISASHGFNKVQAEPFHLHFCNMNRSPESKIMFTRNFPGFEDLMYTTSADSYLEHYSKDELVYLSPDARDTLTEFDTNAVYIIGGMVDKTKIEPLSWAKARMEKVRAVRLPLDEYFKWQKGSKTLTVDQMVKILHTLKQTQNIEQALRHVPSRKRIWRHERDGNY